MNLLITKDLKQYSYMRLFENVCQWFFPRQMMYAKMVMNN